MLKVKRTINSKNSTDEINQWENEIKNSIKKMYLQNKSDNKLIEQYQQAFETIKQEYALIYKENEELKKELNEIKSNQKNQVQNERKRPLSRFDYENEYDNNDNVQYIVRKRKKIPKKFIYEDEEEEETDSENDEIDGEKKIEETIEKKRFKKANKKGISKSIKM